MTNTIIQFSNISKQYVKQRLRYGMLSEAIGQLLHANRQSLIANHNIIAAYHKLI
jgi:hypothetical protein